VPGGNSRQHEAGSEFNTRDSQVPLPRADLDAAGEGFAAICTGEEALKLVEDSDSTTDHIVDMDQIEMS
jgi:hypothetical protein